MFRRRVSSVAGAVALSAALLVAAAPTQPAAGSTAVAATAAVKNVSISATCATATLFCFAPMTTAVATGRPIVWTNNTPAPHQLALCDTIACGVSSGTGNDTGFGSGILSTGQTYSFTFNGLGTYTYYCTVHGYAVMHGTITVDALPTIASVVPSTVPRGSTNLTASVTGTGFRNGVKAKVSGTGVTVSSVARVNATHLTLTISASATASVGLRKLIITNGDGGSASRTGAINVT